MPSLRPDVVETLGIFDRLETMFREVGYLRPKHRQMVAELILVRLAITVENNTKAVVSKVCCGADYVDGSAPVLLARQRSVARAIEAMKSAGMPAGRLRRLRWTDGAVIRESLEGIVDPADPVFERLRAHASTMTEVRHLRNHIVHKNRSSRGDFQKVVMRYYGIKLRHISPGVLLTTDKFGARTVLESVILRVRTLVREMSGAPLPKPLV
jgi:hypothetical protein